MANFKAFIHGSGLLYCLQFYVWSNTEWQFYNTKICNTSKRFIKLTSVMKAIYIYCTSGHYRCHRFRQTWIESWNFYSKLIFIFLTVGIQQGWGGRSRSNSTSCRSPVSGCNRRTNIEHLPSVLCNHTLAKGSSQSFSICVLCLAPLSLSRIKPNLVQNL